MLFFWLTCFSFILFCKSLSLKPLPLWAYDMRLLSHTLAKDLSLLSIAKFTTNFASIISKMMSLKKITPPITKVDNVKELNSGVSVLDLPDLVLECILERLPPEGLCSMASVCSSLRDRCISDHLWMRHMNQKWGKVLGPAAHREWQWQISSRKDSYFCNNQAKPKGVMSLLFNLWPFALVRSSLKDSRNEKSFPPPDSVMSWYLAIESGKFWFPAQVYNRENGHVGFMLSCYDAEVSYNPRNDSFQARYPPHGNRAVAVEIGITWERIRAAPVDTPPHDLHISDCLCDLRPGDHIEIQWRRNKEFPYGWWYGVVGHLETCDGNPSFCRCHLSGTVVLEFNQYTFGSRWRRTIVNRKDHREEGNEADGFYGGIRKLGSNEEISTWKRLWPIENLE